MSSALISVLRNDQENLQLVLLSSCHHNKSSHAFSGSLLPPSASSRLSTSLHSHDYRTQRRIFILFSGSLIGYLTNQRNIPMLSIEFGFCIQMLSFLYFFFFPHNIDCGFSFLKHQHFFCFGD